MKVSVCITTYNHERFIEAAVRSALGQVTAFDFEVIVGDDASVDGTSAILKRLQVEFPTQLRVFTNVSNVGMLQNRIDTQRHCTGEFVALLDGDDVWLRPDKLQRQASFLDEHPGCAVCATSYTTGTSVRPHPRASIMSLTDVIHGGYIMLQSTIMLRRAYLPELPGWFARTPFQDLAMEVLCLQHGFGAVLEDVSTLYRQHHHSTFSAEPEVIKSLVWSIETWRLLRDNLPATHHRSINRRLASAYYQLQEVHLAAGRDNEASLALREANHLASLGDRARRLARVRMPLLYRWFVNARELARYRSPES